MSQRELKSGTKVYWGAPAKPMPEVMAEVISQVVAQVPGIVEAHLPQCFIEGDKEARQVLIVAVQNHAEIPQIAQQLMGKLQPVFAPGRFIEIMPMESNSVPHGVREAGCQIFAGDKKPWWRVW